jgi:glycolate oxidase FAD binding subunit
MHEPADEAALAGIVGTACRLNEPLAVQGAGTKLGMLRPVQAADGLSTRNLTGTTLYAPKELVFAARSGTRLAEVEATLAEEGQHLIAEPPDYAELLGTEGGAQTLGGVVATNLSGPRRVAWGAVRDHVLGMRAVDGTGQVIRSGGRVLKNVTGLDICKLLTGSHGTLGVMTEITLKVLPAPEATGSVVISGLDPVQAVAALSAALGSPYGVSGAAHLPVESAALAGRLAATTLVRIEDFAASVTYRLGRLMDELAAFGATALVDEAASRRLWARVRDAAVLPADAEDAVWRVSVRPSRGPGVLAAAAAQGARGYLDWGGGLVMLAGPAVQGTHAAITRAAAEAGGVWTLLRAPDAMRTSLDVVPREPAALQKITRRVKTVMDPRGVLNPGRVVAGV